MTKTQKARYDRMIRKGLSPRFAEMLALQQPPGTKNTDRAFMQGRLHNEVDNKHDAELVVGKAKKAGIDTNGKVFISSLSDLRGAADPSAWVDSVSELRQRTLAKIEKRKREEEAPAVALSEPIIRDSIRQLVKANPALKSKKKAELREMVLAKHTPRWKKGKK